MTRLSGWCMDELQAHDLDSRPVAEAFHARCHIDTCTCPNHQKGADDAA